MTGEWRIGFCCMELDEKLYFRHCVIVDKNNDILDPTCAAYSKLDALALRKYIIFATLDYAEYMDLIAGNDYRPDLYPCFKVTEDLLVKELSNRNIGYIR